MNDLKEFIKKNKDIYIKELSEYVSIPSISTLKTHRKDIQKAAYWISNRMKKAGLKNVKVIKTAGNPIVYGDYIQKGNKKTLLIYGHYDVQPEDPIKEWKSSPFKLTRKGDKLYGRGVGDNKAPHLSHVIGIEYLLQQKKKLPVNIKFLIEGEEEVGSRNIYDALNKNKKLFKSNIGLVSDGIKDYDFPVIEYGLRGIFCFEINVKCLDKDVHSGIYGGLVDNPAIVLSQIISKLKDKNGNILIPNFYSNVRKVSKEEHNILKSSDLDTKEVIKNTGAKGFNRWR